MKVVVTGGGTGGHIYPALAFIRQVKKTHPEATFLYIGTTQGLEKKIIQHEGIPFKEIDITGFKRSFSFENAKTIIRFLKGVKESKKILQSFNPNVVLGTGGYVSGPVIYAAAKLDIPTMIHEQNSVVGLTNKFLSRYATKVAICFEGLKSSFAADKVVLTGNPRAQEVIDVRTSGVLEEYNLSPHKKTVLVFGGSRGARGINEATEKVLSEWSQKKYQLLYITGEAHYKKIKQNIKGWDLGENISIQPFTHDMPAVLNAVSLVISRAGATTLAELTALGKPSILIPSPYVTANHQEKNARVLEKSGAGVVITEQELLNLNLLQEVDKMMNDTKKLEEMGQAAKKLGKPHAAEDLVNLAFKIMK